MQLRCGRKLLDLSSPVVMGIVNATPDSFSDGGEHYTDEKFSLASALKKVDAMIASGASIIDVGGESTRPGAKPVSTEEEISRVVPLVEAINQRFDTIISVDTSSPAVMTASAEVGAGIINDVRALQREGALEAAVKTGLAVCLMHMQGQPGSMQINPEYEDIYTTVCQFLLSKVEEVKRAGVPQNCILLDPGYGFGKNLTHNLSLLAQQQKLAGLGYPLLVGLSRKSILGQLLGRDVNQRLAGSLALAMLAAQRGASIIRVHDVEQTKDVLGVLNAIKSIESES